MSQPPSKDPLHQEIAALRREIEDLKRQMRQIPSRFPMVPQAAAEAASSIRETITQANSFAAEDVVYNNAGTWQLAQANAAAGAAKYTGVVESSDGASFVVVYSGRIELALTQGTTYYLSDVTPGLLVTRATVTQYQLNIPVLRCVSPTTCIVMSARDIACDMTTLTAGDFANGGGELVINLTAEASVNIDSTDGVLVELGATVGQVSIAMNGSVLITHPDASFEIKPDGSVEIIYTDASLLLETDGTLTMTFPGVTSTLTVDPAHIVGTGRDIRIREVDICDPTGAAKKMLGLFSDYY